VHAILTDNSSMEAARARALGRGIRLEILTIAWMLIEACVAVVCPRRDLGFRPQPTDVELDQALSRCDRESAIR